MTAEQFVTQIRRVQWEYDDGRISESMKERRLDALWDRISEHADITMAKQVNALLEAQRTPETATPGAM